eukprot:9294532-Pyramimonas_sp.AAC.1
MAPKMLQEAPRPPQDGSKKPNSLPRRPPRSKHHFGALVEASDTCPGLAEMAVVVSGAASNVAEVFPPQARRSFKAASRVNLVNQNRDSDDVVCRAE